MKKLSLLLLFIGLSIANTSFAKNHTIKVFADNYYEKNSCDVTVKFYGKNDKSLGKLKFKKSNNDTIETKKIKLSSNVQKIVVLFYYYSIFNKKKHHTYTYKSTRLQTKDLGFYSDFTHPVKMRLTGGKIDLTYDSSGFKKYVVYYRKKGKKYLLSEKKGK